MPLRGRGGRASWPPAAADMLRGGQSGRSKAALYHSPLVEHTGIDAGGCGGPGRSEDSAGGRVAGHEAGKRDGQHKGQNDSAQTEPGQTAFEALQLLFPVPELAQGVRSVLTGLLQNFLDVVGGADQVAGGLGDPGQAVADPAVDGVADECAVILRAGLGSRREGGLSCFRRGFGQPVHGVGLGIDTIRDRRQHGAEKIEGFAQLVVRERGRGGGLIGHGAKRFRVIWFQA